MRRRDEASLRNSVLRRKKESPPRGLDIWGYDVDPLSVLVSLGLNDSRVVLKFMGPPGG